MKCMKWMNWHESIDMNELTWMNWHEWIETNESTWSNWHEGTETHDLKRMNWHEWIETHELTWVNWNEWLDMTDLKWRNWNEWVELNEWMTSNEGIDNELKWTNWNEWIDMNDLSTSSSKSGPSLSVFDDFYVKSSSRDSLVHILSTTFLRGNRDPLAATTDDHFTRKKRRVLRPRLFSSVNSRVPDRSHFMMMWLTWWCGWHDD